MYSSAYYKTKITELENIRDQVRGILPYFEPSEEVLTKSQKYIEEITINGEPIDQGKLCDICSALKNTESDLQSIIKECTERIFEYTTLYNQAVARENAAREEAARIRATPSAARNNNVTISTIR